MAQRPLSQAIKLQDTCVIDAQLVITLTSGGLKQNIQPPVLLSVYKRRSLRNFCGAWLHYNVQLKYREHPRPQPRRRLILLEVEAFAGTVN